MKKFTILLLIFFCLFFNVIELSPAFAAAATLKEGIYTLADFNASPSNSYTVKNVSKTDGVRVIIYDDNHEDFETLKLGPDTTGIETVTILPNYIIVVVGKGEVTITPKSP